MREKRVSASQETGEYTEAPLQASRLEKRKGCDDELIAPPALHQRRKVLLDSERSSFTHNVPKRDEGTIDKEQIFPPALDPRRKMETASSLTSMLAKRVETRDQGQAIQQTIAGRGDQDNGILPALKQVKTMEETRFNAEISSCLLPKRVEEARDSSPHSRASSSDHRDETDDDRLEDLRSFSRDEDDKHFFGRPTTPPRIMSGSLLNDIIPVTWLFDKASRAKDEVHGDAIELVLVEWRVNTVKVKIFDGRNQQVAIHSSYFEHDEMQEVDQMSSKSRGEGPPPALIPTNSWALTRTSNSIADDASECDKENDKVALGSFFCGLFCQESSSTVGPDDIPSEISYRCHRHHHHHAHPSKTSSVPPNDLPTATSMVVSDVSSNSTDASDWSSESSASSASNASSASSEGTSVFSRLEPTCSPETKACGLLVNEKRRPRKQGKWTKFFAILLPGMR